MILAFLLYILTIFGTNAISLFDSNYDSMWDAYKEKYNKVYPEVEENARRLIWESNVQLISRHNLEAELGPDTHTYQLRLNKFSDMTVSELNKYRKCLRSNASLLNWNDDIETFKNPCGKSCRYTLPSSVDWRDKGFVTSIKDQGDCGSCWAFSSTGALEGQTKAKTGSLVSLSEQNLVDCSEKQGNQGCDGGWMEYAFQYVIDNEGIDTEKAYPYKARKKHCKFVRSGVGSNCTKYMKIKQGNEIDLQAAVANVGPIAIAIDASGDKFMSYSKGIYFDKTCTSTELDHAVLVVGYGSENGKDYWIVKNSWGSDWGMDGYILMARNAHNMCGIATHAIFPVV
ncbi:procathepsin L-like [Uloborus diversus]|uniref:procathepsin L-like n=1 Tax=Uloborus diversus TaxID=327109 RepID=UPI002409C3E0|nr:procathepsin L-like [Uloborus diversus]